MGHGGRLEQQSPLEIIELFTNSSCIKDKFIDNIVD